MQTIEIKLENYPENILEEEQCSFRKGRRCTDAVFTLQQIIVQRREYNLCTYILFISYEKEYGNVKREMLWKILTDNGIPITIIAATQSLYKNANIYIKLPNHKLSKTLNINKGTGHDCGLSPTLFNLYIRVYQLIREWKSTTATGFKICNNKILKTTLYADDQIILAKTEDELQIATNTLNKAARK
jgi:hypothetical protein